MQKKKELTIAEELELGILIDDLEETLDKIKGFESIIKKLSLGDEVVTKVIGQKRYDCIKKKMNES